MSPAIVLPCANLDSFCVPQGPQSWAYHSFPSAQETKAFLVCCLPSFPWGTPTLDLTSLGLGNRSDPTLSLCPSYAYVWTTLSFTWRLRKTLTLLCQENGLCKKHPFPHDLHKTPEAAPCLAITRPDIDSPNSYSLPQKLLIELVPTYQSGQSVCQPNFD